VADLAITDQVRVRSRSVVFRGPIDFNPYNTNYDVDPVTGKLLLILFPGTASGEQRSIRWITGWPQIVRDMATAQ